MRISYHVIGSGRHRRFSGLCLQTGPQTSTAVGCESGTWADRGLSIQIGGKFQKGGSDVNDMGQLPICQILPQFIGRNAQYFHEDRVTTDKTLFWTLSMAGFMGEKRRYIRIADGLSRLWDEVEPS